MRWTLAGAVAVLVVLSGVGPVASAASPGPETPDTAAPNPPDPERDVLGWERGYWYNESIAINQADGLSPRERRVLVARTMARVERIRRLEFRSWVPVTVISRAQYARLARAGTVSEAQRTFTNAKFEALFMINESTDAVEVGEEGAATAVAGFYTPRFDRIVLISSGGGSRIEETTLAHELTHALQDQHFDLQKFERPTREAHNAIDGLVEGDANLVQYLYERRCAGVWNGTCVSAPRRGDSGDGGSLAHVGPALLQYQPYSDGPAFVREFRTRGGWDRVNDLYGDPPASTEQTIHPELYGQDQPATVRVPDRSTAAWDRLRVSGRPDYAEVGEAGLASMLVRPAIETRGRVEVVSAESFFTDNQSFDPYNYDTPYTAGWDGDKLVVYTSQRTPPGEFGYVYRTVWDSPAEAREFLEGYRQLLAIEGARRVEGRPNTWRIPAESGYTDAFWIQVRGDTVTIVNAPTVEALSGVYRGAGTRADDPTAGYDTVDAENVTSQGTHPSTDASPALRIRLPP